MSRSGILSPDVSAWGCVLTEFPEDIDEGSARQRRLRREEAAIVGSAGISRQPTPQELPDALISPIEEPKTSPAHIVAPWLTLDRLLTVAKENIPIGGGVAMTRLSPRALARLASLIMSTLLLVCYSSVPLLPIVVLACTGGVAAVDSESSAEAAAASESEDEGRLEGNAQAAQPNPRLTNPVFNAEALPSFVRADTLKRFGRAAFLVGEYFCGPDGSTPRSPDGPMPVPSSSRARTSSTLASTLSSSLPSTQPTPRSSPLPPSLAVAGGGGGGSSGGGSSCGSAPQPRITAASHSGTRGTRARQAEAAPGVETPRTAGGNLQAGGSLPIDGHLQADGGSDAVRRTLSHHEGLDSLLPTPGRGGGGGGSGSNGGSEPSQPLAVAPSQVDAALTNVLALAEAHRWLDAGQALRELDATVHAAPAAPAVVELQRALRVQGEVARAVATVRARYAECVGALRVLSEGADIWRFGSQFRGVTSHYKHDDAGRLWLRTEGVMDDVSMLECVALWKEIDLFDAWFPLCQSSKVLAAQGRVELLAWMELAVTAQTGCSNRGHEWHCCPAALPTKTKPLCPFSLSLSVCSRDARCCRLTAMVPNSHGRRPGCQLASATRCCTDTESTL